MVEYVRRQMNSIRLGKYWCVFKYFIKLFLVEELELRCQSANKKLYLFLYLKMLKNTHIHTPFGQLIKP